MKEDTSFTTTRGHRTGLSLYGADLAPETPCVVYLHGFKGFKDWGFVPYLGTELARAGLRMLAMNFSHNGIGDDPLEFTELDMFRDNTFSLEVGEAREVVNAYAAGELFGAAANVDLGLLGHSRGGGIALLAARDLPAVKAVCTWAAVSTFARYPQETLDKWKAEGVIEMLNSRTGQLMQLGWQLHQDLIDHGQDQLNIEKAARELNKPYCIIHGKDDETVSPRDARALFNWADSNATEVHEISGTGHTFGAKHPFEGSNPALESAITHTRNFFLHHLNARSA